MRDGKKGLRAAIIGLGVGERHIAGYEADARAKVVALCDIDGEKLAAVASRHPGRMLTNDPNRILSDPDIDVVSIASYDDAHCEQVVAAIRAGKHVFVEKPLCLRQSEFEAIGQELARMPGICLSSNLILRRTPRFIELRSRIKAGDLGEPYYVEGSYDYGRIHKIMEGWRGQIPFYSVVHGGAIHLIDLMLWLTSAHVEEVHAFGNRISTRNSSFRHPDLVAALLRFSNGLVGKVTSNYGSVTPHHHELNVFGTAGTFIHGFTGAAYSWARDGKGALEPVVSAYPGAAKGDMLPSFIKHILDGESPEVTAQEVFDAMAVSLAIEESLTKGEPVRVRYLSAGRSETGVEIAL